MKRQGESHLLGKPEAARGRYVESASLVWADGRSALTRRSTAVCLVALSVAAVQALLGCSQCAHQEPPGGQQRDTSATISTTAALANSAAPISTTSAAGAVSPASELTWRYEQSAAGPMQVVVRVPEHSAGQTFPVLIALHGRGEAFKGPARGARGWVEDYWLPQAEARLKAPPLTAEDFQGFVEPARLQQLNRSLAAQGYRGLIVICPYTPDILQGDRAFELAAPFRRFLLDELLPRVRKETPASPTAQATGIDGVSLGGRASLLVGLGAATSFGSVATLQAALDMRDVNPITALAQKAHEQNPGLKLRLLTSDGDYFLATNRAVDRAWTERAVPHDFVVVAGPHDYAFNRGPGALEMLVYHDRVLRGEPGP